MAKERLKHTLKQDEQINLMISTLLIMTDLESLCDIAQKSTKCDCFCDCGQVNIDDGCDCLQKSLLTQVADFTRDIEPGC